MEGQYRRSAQRKVDIIKRSLAGKKGSITKRVEQLNTFVAERGSRRKIDFLRRALLDVREATKELFQKLVRVLEEPALHGLEVPESQWMDEINERVDNCVAEIEQYLDDMEERPDSSKESITRSWIKKHTPLLTQVRFESSEGSSHREFPPDSTDDETIENIFPRTGYEDAISMAQGSAMNAEQLISAYQEELISSTSAANPSLQDGKKISSQLCSEESMSMTEEFGAMKIKQDPSPPNPISTHYVHYNPYLDPQFGTAPTYMNGGSIPATSESFAADNNPERLIKFKRELILPRTVNPAFPGTMGNILQTYGRGRRTAAETRLRLSANSVGTNYRPTRMQNLPGPVTQQRDNLIPMQQMGPTVSSPRYGGNFVPGNYQPGNVLPNNTTQQHDHSISMQQMGPTMSSPRYGGNLVPGDSQPGIIPPNNTTQQHDHSTSMQQMGINGAELNDPISYRTDLANQYPDLRNSTNQFRSNQNEVDSWIDQLNEHEPEGYNSSGIPPDMTTWLVQQNLPKVKIPTFDGSPALWVEFITNFKELVHDQQYLNNAQKRIYLLQHLSGEAKRSVQGYPENRSGYIGSLKRLKFMFGQRSRIAQAALQRVTSGKTIGNDDQAGLVEYYYTISDCLITLKRLNYVSDLHSSDTLRQAVRRLPSRLHNKWAEYCLSVRRKNEEPSLIHLESWVQARVLAQKDASIPRGKFSGKDNFKTSNEKDKVMINTNSVEETKSVTEKKKKNTDPACPICKKKHFIWKCMEYKKLTPIKKHDEIKRLELCFNCLYKNHDAIKCASTNRCLANGCGKRHHTSLHQHFAEMELNKKEDSSKEKEDVESGFTGMLKSTKVAIHLQIVPVKLTADGKSSTTYALLDSGSECTLIKESMAKELNLKGKNKTIRISTFKDKEESMSVREVALDVSSTDGADTLKIGSAYVIPAGKFHMPSQEMPSDYDRDVYTHLDGIELGAVEAEDITILLGANVPEAMVPLEIRRGGESQPLAWRTRFGWTLFGASAAQRSPELKCNLMHSSRDDQQIHQMVERFWIQEHYTDISDREVGMSVHDRCALATLESDTKIRDDKYEVPMLWKNKDVELTNNYPQALQRFKFLERRLKADEKLYIRYKKIITEYLDLGYSREMSDEEVQLTSPRTWYLPHHPVFNPKKPEKLRVVFDAAASYNGKSLNDSLLTGPDLMNNLVGVLLRFRTDPVALAADVESMFHQIRVTPADSDSLRFLWKEDIHSDDPPKVLQMLAHIFGAKDSASCANYAVKRNARDNQNQFDASTLESALRSFYMDDLLKSLKTDDMAIKLAFELIQMLKLGGFRLTKFISNSQTVLNALPPTEISSKIQINLTNEEMERALGLFWKIKQDSFTFQSDFEQAPYTKRGILRTTSRVFDPLGFLGGYIVKAKMLLQELWQEEYGWDQEVDEEYILVWKQWLDGLKNIHRFELPRCYFGNCVVEYEIHIFGDASEKAYGAVAYLVGSTKNGEKESALVMSKSKLAPIKVITLPRLELNAAVMVARLYRKIITELDLPLHKAFFWSDSTLTLQYIHNGSRRFKKYVANRVTEILEVSEKEHWNYVPSELNPADIITKGVYDPALLMKPYAPGKCWVTGPEFIVKDASDYPQQPHIVDVEMKNPEIKGMKVLLTGVKDDELVKVERFSRWCRLRRATAWVLRFINNTRRPQKPRNLELEIDEIQISTNLLIKEIQKKAFGLEVKSLLANGTLTPKSSLASLTPFIDDVGVLRVGGRLKHADISPSAKHPAVLPKYHHVTKLIIREEHERCGHLGREHVLAELRQQYWILNGRAAIQRIINSCFTCKVKKAKKVEPFMADLPEGRLAIGKAPFSNCGVDLFGPILIKQGRKRLKRWGTIFTGLTVRCVHLEVVENADTDSFINTMRRFVNRRSAPETMYSDCGTNFKGATKELQEFLKNLDHETITTYATSNGMSWKFNPPASPHMGGVWERMIRSVKEIISGLTKDIILTDFQLMTLLTEVESILNNRPLTHSSEDTDDLEALTPNHALIGHSRNWNNMGTFPENFSSRKKWKQVQYLANNFWKRWRKEYLPSLIPRGKGRKLEPNIEVGELVVLADCEAPRGKWTLGRITKTMPGNDGTTRVAEVRTGSGTYVRPVVKLYPLEENGIENECENDGVNCDASEDVSENDTINGKVDEIHLDDEFLKGRGVLQTIGETTFSLHR